MIINWLADIVAYSLQLTVLVATVVVVTRVLPIGDARWRFQVFQALFIAAVLLPTLQQWSQTGRPASVNALSTIIRTAEAATSGSRGYWLKGLAFVLVAGACVRLSQLVIGWVVIRRFVRRSIPLGLSDCDCVSAVGCPVADVRLSNDVHSPATVGIWRAVVLVPPPFQALSPAAERAVLLHELLHVRRRDWLRMVVEELWCALLWFHPLARMLVTRLDLTREMLVHRYVLDTTGDRRAYAQALLSFASDHPSTPLAAIPLIRRAHLSDRIAAVAQEAPMSRRFTFVAAAVMCLSVLTTTATAVRLLPMDASTASSLPLLRSAAAQDAEVVQPGDGVTLPKPTYEQKPEYTPAAMQALIEGTVLLAIVVQTDGTVGRVRVTKSLDMMYGLDDAAVRAARGWRFEPGRKDGKPVAVEVALEFRFTLK
jgi:TonB family protein